jgi:hypothetical protein
MSIDPGCSIKNSPQFPKINTMLPQCSVTPTQKEQRKRKNRQMNQPDKKERMPNMKHSPKWNSSTSLTATSPFVALSNI